MLDHDLRSLRDDIDSQVQIPPFDSLVSRGRQRRRRTGAGIAVLALLAGGVAIGAGEVVRESASPPPTTTPNVPVRSADELIDDPASDLWHYQKTESGLEFSTWGNVCDQDNCPFGLAWTTDGWQTRSTHLVPTWGSVYWTGDRFVVYEEDIPSYVLTPAGDLTPIRNVDTAAPGQPGDIVVGREFDSIDALLLDPRTGITHPILEPKNVDVHQVGPLGPDQLGLFGKRSDGSGVFATSIDGGRTWVQHDVPETPEGTWFVGDGTHVAILKQGLGGDELLVSSDSGETWTPSIDTPFNHADCLAPTSGMLLLTNGTRLFRSTDDSWVHFELIDNVPELQCLDAAGDLVSSTGADKRSGLVSTNLGDTWTDVSPR